MAKIAPPSAVKTTKRNHLIIAGIVALVVGLGLMVGISMMNNGKPTKKAEPKSPVIAGQNLNQEDAFRGKLTGDVTQLNSDVTGVNQKLDMLTRQLESLEKQNTELKQTQENLLKAQATKQNTVQPIVSLEALGPPPNLTYAGSKNKDATGENAQNNHNKDPFEIEKPAKLIHSVVMPINSDASENQREIKTLINKKSVEKQSNQKEPDATYIPSSTMVRAVVLSGVVATTGGNSAQNALPVVLRLVDNASLPNGFRALVKNCRMIGKTVADLSTERAHISIESMACIDPQGRAIDMPIKASVFGEDGKPGLRGQLVERNGRALANATLAAFGSGVGSAFRAGATTNTATLAGNVETTNAGQEFRAGFGEGMGRAFDRISQYYLKMADQIFPAIEIDSGRTVDVVFLKGTSLQIAQPNSK